MDLDVIDACEVNHEEQRMSEGLEEEEAMGGRVTEQSTASSDRLGGEWRPGAPHNRAREECERSRSPEAERGTRVERAHRTTRPHDHSTADGPSAVAERSGVLASCFLSCWQLIGQGLFSNRARLASCACLFFSSSGFLLLLFSFGLLYFLL